MEWKDGVHKSQDFSEANVHDIYKLHLRNLELWENRTSTVGAGVPEVEGRAAFASSRRAH